MRLRPVLLMAGCLLVFAAGSGCFADDTPARPEIVRQIKPAVALVKVPFGGQATAFCINSSGLFVTNFHVVENTSSSADTILILNPGLGTEQAYRAKVIRSDKDLDLALLQVVPAKPRDQADPSRTPGRPVQLAATLPALFPSIPIGDDAKISELDELIAFGFPFGTALAEPGQDPTVTVNVVNVSSLRSGPDNTLHRIQLDSNLNPGNSGGPVVDHSGKLIGVVVAGVVGRGINLAIPARDVRKFLQTPVISLTLPTVSPADKYKPAHFEALAQSFLPDAKPAHLELVLSQAGLPDRHVPMNSSGGKYVADVPPFSRPDSNFTVPIQISYPDASITASAQDQTIHIGGQSFQLSGLQQFSLQPGAQNVSADGKPIPGAVSDLAGLTVHLGGQPVKLNLAGATAIAINTAAQQRPLRCVLIARSGDAEIGRVEENLYVEGSRHDSLDNLAKGEYIKPLNTGKAATYLKAVSTAGDFIGQGQNFNYGANDNLALRGSNGAISLYIDGWSFTFAPPHGQSLAVGHYDGAIRFPFNENAPGMDITGHGRGSNTVAGSFVIWELEFEGNNVKKLAIDFIFHSENERAPPIYGMLRYNSSLE